MSKKKQRPAARPNPAIRLSALRPRLDVLLREPGDEASSAAALDTLTEGLKASAMLPILLAASAAAAPEAQAQLGHMLPEWLQTRGYLSALRELVELHALDATQQRQALSLLEAGGEDVAALATAQQAWDPFYAAYYSDAEYQASLTIFGYTNQRMQRVQGLGVLIDFQPPWEGAAKDGLRYAQRPPEEALDEFLSLWRSRGLEPQAITPAEAKHRFITALEQNRRQDIRLHADLAAERELFVRFVLPLPDAPDTPPFSSADFDELATNGRRAEMLQRAEQTFGYQTRMVDGEVIRILRPID